MENNSIRNLIRHFEDSLRQTDRYNMGAVSGNEPQFPMLVIYLGDAAALAHTVLSKELKQLWPQYANELKFIGIHRPSGEGEFFEPDKDAEEGFIDVSTDRVHDIISNLFGLSAHFKDRSKLLVYYILDTSGCTSEEEFAAWLSSIEYLKQIIMAEHLSMLIILLNENFKNQAAAKTMRNSLCRYCQDVNETAPEGLSIVLLSNRRSDNAILEVWDICYQISACLIALSNNRDSRQMIRLFERSLKTVKYAREEKPTADIGQVITNYIIQEFDNSRTSQKKPHLEIDDTLRQRLGLDTDGTVRILNSYADKELLPLLPEPEILEYFPRVDIEARGYMADLSAADFNNLTLGAWDAFLGQVADRAEEKLKADIKFSLEWQDEYEKLLTRNFNPDELIYLAGHKKELSMLFKSPRMPSQEAGVLSSAEAMLKYMLSSNETLINIFIDTITKQGETADDFVRAWSELVKSRNSLFAVRDANIKEFYEKKVRGYFDRCGNKKTVLFEQIHDSDKLEEFIEQIIDEVIEQDPFFCAPFEEELEQRLKGEASPVDAKAYILKKLTGENIDTYLQVNFSLGSPLCKAMLIKKGTPLYNNLINSLAETYFYDTGCSDKAETLVIYEISTNDLING